MNLNQSITNQIKETIQIYCEKPKWGIVHQNKA